MTTASKLPVLTCFVVSENPCINKHILQISNELPNVKLVGVCENQEQQYTEIEHKNPDVIFWDKAAIYPSSAECLKKMLTVPQIVLLSKAGETTLDLPDYLVTTEIEHPLDPKKFAETLALVVDIKEEKDRMRLKKIAPIVEPRAQITTPDYVFFRVKGRITRFNVEEILFFQGQGEFVLMRTTRGDFHLNMIMKNLVQKLEHPLFLKTHRAFVVNVSKISHIEENEVIIGDDTILISRAHRNLVREKLNII
jgi:two-component system, LytTR family, response regulator